MKILDFFFIECFMTTFLHTHSWINWVDEDDDEVGLKEKPEDTSEKYLTSALCFLQLILHKINMR